MDRRVDIALAVGCVVFGSVVVFQARQLRDNDAFRDLVGTAGLPTLLGSFIAIGGAIIILRYVLTWRRQDSHEIDADGRADEPNHPASAARSITLWAVLVGYAFALPTIGFLIATPVAMFCCLWLAHFRRPIRIALLSLGLPIVLYGVFVQLLGVGLPSGVLDGLA